MHELGHDDQIMWPSVEGRPRCSDRVVGGWLNPAIAPDEALRLNHLLLPTVPDSMSTAPGTIVVPSIPGGNSVPDSLT